MPDAKRLEWLINMERIDIRLKESDRQILKSIIGKTLDCIEHDEFTFTDSSSQVVKISSYGETIFLYSFVEELDFYGSTEDVAVWTVEKTEYPLVAEKSFIKMPIQQTITKISLIQENQQMFDQGVQTYDVWVTRGIIIDVGDHQISFEKPVWFSEDIIIRKGYELQKTFRSAEAITNAENWNDGMEMTCSRNVETL